MEATNAMTGLNVTAKPKTNTLKKFIKFSLYGILAIIVSIFLFNLIWQMSGSNRWELEIDKDGTQVYSLKSPGASAIKFKGVTRYKYTYGHMLSAFIDDNFIDDCTKFLPGCVEYKFLSKWNSELLFNVQLWRFKLFFPFDDREMLLKGSVIQDKVTKNILLENSAAPNIIPLNDCCVRIAHLHNTWRYTPLENGEVEVEFIQDLDMGGFFPDFLLSFGASAIYQILHVDIPTILDSKEEYRHVKLDFIEEYK